MENKRKMFALIIVLASLGILALIFTDKARGEEGKLGLGVNYPGIQVRYGQLEFKAQFGALNTILAGRGYFPVCKIKSGDLSFNPYWGLEGGWILSSYLKGGFEAGGFSGVEMFFNPHISLNADIGIYIIDVWATGNMLDLGLITNLGVYYYF